MAVNVTGLPEHTGFVPAATDTLTCRFELTDIITLFEVAGEPVAQVRFDVNTQLKVSELFGI